jgi:hypothetical protein
VKGVSISRSGAVFRPGRVDALPIGQAPEAVTVIEDGLSDFARLVAPVRRELAAHRWVLSCREEYLLVPDHARSAILAESSERDSWKYVEGRFLEAVADGLIDEWWDFFAVDEPVENLDDWIHAFWDAARSRSLAQYLTDRVSLFCAGIDGARWDFFAADLAIVDAIYRNAIIQPGMIVRATSLDELIRYTYYGGAQSR